MRESLYVSFQMSKKTENEFEIVDAYRNDKLWFYSCLYVDDFRLQLGDFHEILFLFRWKNQVCWCAGELFPLFFLRVYAKLTKGTTIVSDESPRERKLPCFPNCQTSPLRHNLVLRVYAHQKWQWNSLFRTWVRTNKWTIHLPGSCLLCVKPQSRS